MTSDKPLLAFDDVQIGDELPFFETEPVSRLALALYCGASGDHNPIHVDIDFARTAGMPDVIAHGMLPMAWLARVLTDWVPQTALREYSVRFAAMTQIGERISCAGKVIEKFESDGERCVRVEVLSRNAAGQIKLSGEAVVALA
ncbi:MAG: MaoC family dehydratase [Rhodoferax sp.]